MSHSLCIYTPRQHYLRGVQQLTAALSLLASGLLIAETSSPGAETVVREKMRLEEVIVTAQKRAENVRDVPISLSVFSGDQLRDSGIQSFNEMARMIPNVSMNDGSNSLYVRGIGTPELNPVGEQAVAYIVDGIYVPKYAYLKSGFLDLERIEVLKGPQGTLFGRNATSGVINITNAQPGPEYEAFASLTRGDRDMREVEAAISGPVIGDLSARLAFKQRREEGSTFSTSSQEMLGERDQRQARLILRYDVTDSLDITLGITQFDYFIGTFLGYEIHAYPDDLRAVAEILDPGFETNFDRRTSLPKNSGDRLENRSEGSGKIIPLEINWELWDHTLTAVTGFADIETFDGGDVDFLDVKLVGLTADIADDQVSHELRITSPPGWLEYTAGVYYMEGDSDALITVPLFGDFARIASVGPLAALPLVSDILLGAIGSEYDVLDTLVGDFQISTRSTGIFGQLKWALTDYLSLTMGVRKSKDVKRGVINTYTSGPLPFWQQFTDAPFQTNETIVDRDTSPKLSLSWDISEAVTFYATRAFGFRAGSYNAGATQVENVLFRAESSETTEAGIKTELFDGAVRLNAGWFKTDYEDYQLSTFTGLGYATANAPQATLEGVEADVMALLSRGLIVTASFGYNDARYEHFPNAGCPTQAVSDGLVAGEIINPFEPKQDCDLSGKQLHRAPKRNGSLGFDYTVDLARFDWPFDVFVGADASYRDDEFLDSDLDPIDFQEAYWLYNARLGIKDSEGTWRLEIHGKNLGDEQVKLFSGDGVAQPGSHIAGANDPTYYFTTFYYRY